MNGVGLAKFSFYGLLAIFIVDIIATIILMGYYNSLRDFSSTKTFEFFNNDFEILKENSTDNFKRLISYENEIKELKDELEKVGQINECIQEKYDYRLVSFGPNLKYNKLNLDLLGEYSIRCYGENKSFDLLVFTEYENGRWLVDSYKINSNLGNDLIQKEK